MTSTAVRVGLRVRPLTQKEQLSNCSECLSYIPNEPQILIGTDKSFTYDYVFNTNTDQANVYHTAAGPLMQKFMDGFNATILAYGQTGSGKTYSMGTGLENTNDPENEGIVPRCILELFEELQNRADKDPEYNYEVAVSFLELYNEELIDLLNPSTAQKRKSGNTPNSTEVSIREDIAGNIYWSGVREEPCQSPEELLGFLAKGSLCRTTGSTEMNTVSSRSHAIFSVILKQTKPEDEEGNEDNNNNNKSSQTLTSKFHFVDLAGSERLNRTKAQGDRAKEGIAINSGLLALGNVISALGDDTRRATHIPYRDSKLTRLLQDSLGGNSQTLMLACVSPADSNFMETLNTLKYANRARNIKNRVTINQDFAGSSIEVNQLRSLVARLRMEIQSLRADGNGETYAGSIQRDEEVRGLRNEVTRLRDRIDDMSTNLIQVTSERDTLVMERELGEFMDEEGSIDSQGVARPRRLSGEDPMTERMEKLKTHPIIAQYQKTIQDLNNELADTRDRLAFLESVKPAMQAMALAKQQASFSGSISCASRGEPSLSATGGGSASQRRKRHRRRRGGRMSATSSSTTTTVRPVKVASRQRYTRGANKSNNNNTAPMSSYQEPDIPEYDDDEGFVNDQDEDIRQEVKDSIAKARDEIRKGMEVLELIKPLDDTAKAWEEELEAFEAEERRIHGNDMHRAHSDEGTFSSTPSPVGNEMGDHFRTDSELLEEIETLAVPAWEDPEKTKQDPLDKESDQHTIDSRNNNDATSKAMLVLQENSKHNPQMVRMLHQIQSDIKVKEKLVSHLEKSETEYAFMRRKFDDKITHLQGQLAELQRERDAALMRTKNRFVSTKSDMAVQMKEKQQLIEIRHAYEAKMKNLLSEIQELRRKYSQTTTTMQATRNQNETLLRSLRVNVETLQVEKKRMVKRMKVEAERVREQMSTQERRIHQLQRQQAEATMAKRRLEREHENQKLMLKKRNEEILINHNQLKQMTNVLKKAVREGGILDERLLNKVSHIVGGSFAIVARGGTLGFGQRRVRKKVNPIPVQVRATRKKELLDKALCQYIQGKQAVVEMEQLLVRRERLAGEKLDVLEDRKHIYLAEKENADMTGQPMDTMAIELMDERIDLMSAEISYLSARIRALQSEAAGESMEDEAGGVQHTRPEKHVTFADEIITNPPPNDEWADMDAFEEQFSVPSNASPEMAQDITVKLLKSLESDECKRIAESLVDDIMGLRMSECNRQVTQQNLEKTVMDLRRTLIVMKRAAIATTVENERRIRKLEERSTLTTTEAAARGPSPMDVKIEEYINGGNTIFDKIYEDGLRGMIDIPESEIEMTGETTTTAMSGSPNGGSGGADSSGSSVASTSFIADDILMPSMDELASPQKSPTLSCSSITNSNKPPQPLKSMVEKRSPGRDSTPSPDRFYNMIQKRLSWQQRAGGSESPVPITMISPAEFARYATDRDSSTSSIRSSHLRRSSLQSDYSSSQSANSWNNTISSAGSHHQQQQQQLLLQQQLSQSQSQQQRKRAFTVNGHQPPRQRASLRELSLVGSAAGPIPNGRETAEVNDHTSGHPYPPPLPPSSPLANHSSIQRQYKRQTMPSLSTLERPTTPASGNVFDRLSQTPTRASRAKMSYQRHSSGSVDELRQRWEQQQQQMERVASPFY
ncbi:hypothetical protein BDA99DRAFT_492852 [Phascolomyces articulosus]|uniref:Kinesin motor domain-containing protein n=1 Tax=Phascolomyces articulosus TaxID=60185 RepID=A0AAD5KRV5_9FUNG|nr:hypothetical protein BDA99DRAFT_492852 [Phascolomyces articulosus]